MKSRSRTYSQPNTRNLDPLVLKMDDLMLHSAGGKAAADLLSLKGRDWSSLQNLVSDESEESAGELTPPPQANGYLEPLEFTGDDKYVHSSDESSLPDKHHDTTTKLKLEDIAVFGLRPAYDQFFLVVCEHCKGVYKPQALTKHIETRHAAGALDQHAPNRESTTAQLASLKPEREESCSLTGDGFNSQNNHQHNQTNSHNSSNPSTASSSPLAALSDSNSLVRRPTGGGGGAGGGVGAPAVAAKPKLLPCKDRKYDPDKHCGVRLTEDAQPCTRSLTCKTHSLTLRRSVPGRRDSFDRLLNEHRTAKEAALRAAGVEVKPTKLQLKQQARLQKSGQLKGDQQQPPPPMKDIGSLALKDNQSTGQAIQLKIHLQSPTTTGSLAACPPASPFKTFSSTALQSPTTNSFVKQFTFGNNQQLSKLLSSPVRPAGSGQPPPPPPPPLPHTNPLLASPVNRPSSNPQQQHQHQQPASLPSSIQVINTTASMANSTYQHNSSLPAPPAQSNGFVLCDLNPATISHYPKPAAVCTFNERRLSIYTQSSNKILSAKLFNRKQDYAYSALSILAQRPLTPSQSNSRSTDFSSNSNSQESFANSFHQDGRSLLRNGLSPPGRKDHSIAKNYLFGDS